MSTNSAIATINGLGSGLDINGIISQLDTANRLSITGLTNQQTALNTQNQAWNSWNTQLLAILTQANTLATAGSQAGLTATSSDSSVTASSGTGAAAGSYTFTVDHLATAQQLASDNTYAPTDLVGAGTVNITVGGKTIPVSVGATATLSDLSNAINAAKTGVTANIINVSSTQQRLVLTSQTTGSAGAMTVDFSGLSGGTAPQMTRQMTAAQDTQITFGENTPQAFTVTASGTQLTDVIKGLTLNLSAASVGKTVTVNVGQDTSSLASNINGLVTQYNNLVDTYNQLNSFDATTKTSGVLFGDANLRSSFNAVTSAILNPPTGVTGSITNLTSLGITMDKTGHLQVDQTKLNNAITSNQADVAAYFSQSTSTTNPAVTYLSDTDTTQSSGATGYAVNITQLATKSTLTMGTSLPTTLGQDETLTLNGQAIQLTAGSTSDQILQAINSNSTLTGVTASLGGDSGQQLVFTQNSYGATPMIQVNSSLADGTPNSTGISNTLITDKAAGDGNTGVVGFDVAGTIGGLAATGSGQTLTGSTGAANGLQLNINATTLGDGNFGAVNISRGVGSLLQTHLSALTDSVSGTITTIENGLTSQSQYIQKQIDAANAVADQQKQRLTTEYNTMDAAIAQLRSQGSELTSMIDGLNGVSSSSSTSSTSSSSGSSSSSSS